MATSESAAGETPQEAVAIQYRGKCSEGNCDFTVDCSDEAVAHRTAGRHEGNTDLTHQVDIRAVITDA